jgi:hypothetical protein
MAESKLKKLTPGQIDLLDDIGIGPHALRHILTVGSHSDASEVEILAESHRFPSH